MTDKIPIWKEPVRGGYPDPRVFGMSIEERMRAFVEGLFPRPPISHLTGIQFTENEEGSPTITMPASKWFLASQGNISAGSLLMLADVPLGNAVGISLPPATPMTTAELSLTFLEPVAADGGEMNGAGRLIHLGKRLGLSAASITDSSGRLVAHGTSICYVFDQIPGIVPPNEIVPIATPEYPTPDPYLREPEGEVISWEVWKTMNGLEILEAQIAGDLPNPPIHHLTGLTLTEASEGKVTFIMPASEWLNSPTGRLQGGSIGMLGHAALATAVISTLPAGTAYSPVDVKVNFLRPVLGDGRDLIAHGVVTHRGKTLAIGVADIFNSEGKKVATATGSTMIVSERPTGSDLEAE